MDLDNTVVDRFARETEKEILVAANLKLRKLPPREGVSPPPPTTPPIVDDPSASASEVDDVLSVDSTTVASATAPEADHVPESRHEAIARAAYFLAEARGFEQGRELEDWLAAERQLHVPEERQPRWARRVEPRPPSPPTWPGLVRFDPAIRAERRASQIIGFPPVTAIVAPDT